MVLAYSGGSRIGSLLLIEWGGDMKRPHFSGAGFPLCSALAGAMLLGACGSSAATDGTSAAAAQQTLVSTSGAALHRDGAFMVDADNRVVLLHGVNAVWKLAPYSPPDTAAGFTAADAAFLAANGFNVV